jgi:hypothetical protein
MNLNMFYRVVAPTLVRRGSVFVAISSRAEKDNFFHRMMDLKYPNGRHVFHNMEFKLVCEDCEAEGLADKCKHLEYELPWWQDKRRHGKLELMMQDSHDDYMREIRGVEVDSNVTPAFDHNYVTKLRDADRLIDLPITIRHVFVTVDPAAGGDRSKFAVVSCVYFDQKIMVS